jgi:hypothetical protein
MMAVINLKNAKEKVVAKGKGPSSQSGLNKTTMAPAFWAMDYYFDTLKKAVASAPSGGTQFGEKLKGYAEENIRATHDLIRQLTEARDFEAVLRIRNQFIRSQLKALGEQAEGLGEIYTKPSIDPAKK